MDLPEDGAISGRVELGENIFQKVHVLAQGQVSSPARRSEAPLERCRQNRRALPGWQVGHLPLRGSC